MNCQLSLIACLLTLTVVGCNHGNLPTIQMTIGSKSYTLEVASTEEAQRHGLMKRDSMPADHGMIFVFPSEEPRAFWMQNTRIPLDILFVNAAGRVVSIHQMKPYDESGTHSAGPAQYAIELNQGTAAASGIKAGDTLTIPTLPK